LSLHTSFAHINFEECKKARQGVSHNGVINTQMWTYEKHWVWWTLMNSIMSVCPTQNLHFQAYELTLEESDNTEESSETEKIISEFNFVEASRETV
jgi:hypothetical protein